MHYIIKDLNAATLAMFDSIGTENERAAMDALEEAEKKNDSIFWYMIAALHAGVIDAIRHEETHLYYIYTRSAQRADAIQKTVFFDDENGHPVPLSHDEITTPEEAGPGFFYGAGVYETITY